MLRMRVLCTAATFAMFLTAGPLPADQVPVRYTEGRIHGFLVLRDLDDNVIASGDTSQSVSGGRVTNELIFHFKDGSLHQETVVYSQRRTFQLLTYHLVQKGPSFKRATDLSVNASTGAVTVHSIDEKGKEETITDHMKIPADLANGMVPTLLGDLDPKVVKTTLSMIVTTPKPRLVKLEISPMSEESFSIGGTARKATRWVVKVDIGGLAGAIAPVIGKQPPDTQVWMVEGKVPGFVRSEGPLADGSPVWRIEMASPVWPKSQVTEKH